MGSKDNHARSVQEEIERPWPVSIAHGVGQTVKCPGQVLAFDFYWKSGMKKNMFCLDTQTPEDDFISVSRYRWLRRSNKHKVHSMNFLRTSVVKELAMRHYATHYPYPSIYRVCSFGDQCGRQGSDHYWGQSAFDAERAIFWSLLFQQWLSADPHIMVGWRAHENEPRLAVPAVTAIIKVIKLIPRTK